jgi:cyanophycinase-like exopeptidase
MNILVVGSTHFIGSESVREELISACKEIGKALAEKGHTIIVGSEKENTVDRYVVEGANTIAGDNKAKVLVLRPAKGEAPFFKDADKFSKVVFDYRRRGKGWTVGRG